MSLWLSSPQLVFAIGYGLTLQDAPKAGASAGVSLVVLIDALGGTAIRGRVPPWRAQPLRHGPTHRWRVGVCAAKARAGPPSGRARVRRWRVRLRTAEACPLRARDYEQVLISLITIILKWSYSMHLQSISSRA